MFGFQSVAASLAAKATTWYTMSVAPQFDIPGPKENQTANQFGAAAAGMLLTIAAWVGLIVVPIALIATLKRSKEKRQEGLTWALGGLVVYIVAESFAQVVPAVKGLVVTPLSALKG